MKHKEFSIIFRDYDNKKTEHYSLMIAQPLVTAKAFTHFLGVLDEKWLSVFSPPNNGRLGSPCRMADQSGIFTLIDSRVRACLLQLDVGRYYMHTESPTLTI